MQGMKEVPQKVNTMVHCKDEALQKEPEVTGGYRNKVAWSTEINEARCFGNDRLFDKIMKKGHAYEDAQANREKKLSEYIAKPQRGARFDATAGFAPAKNEIVVSSQRSGPQGIPNKVVVANNRSASQLDTLETVSGPFPLPPD